MSTATALLNKMATISGSSHKTPKRQRESSGADASPSKRRAVTNTRTLEPTSYPPRKSKSRLSRPSLPLPASPARASRRGANQFEVPESPEETKESEPKPGKIAPKPKKMVRKVGQKKAKNKSPFKGKGFDGLGELNSGARLTSFDSPAKNTRSRPKNPLNALRIGNLQMQGDSSGDPQKQEGKENPADETAAERQVEEGSYAPSGATSRTSDCDGPGPEEIAEEVEDLQNRVSGSPVDHADETDEDVEDEPAQQSQQQKSSMKKVTPSRKKQTSAQNDNISSQAAAATTALRDRSRAANLRQQETHSALAENEDSVDETEESAPEHDQPEASQRRRGRTAMSQEERQARIEAEAEKRKENAMETEAAELAAFDKRAQRFVQGIEDTVVSLGGVEAWSKMGGGAKTITTRAARKTKMETERCQSVWRKAQELSRWFNGFEEAREEDIVRTLSSLLARATWKHLSRDGDIRRGDQAVIEIYEHLIPQSVYLIKSALNRRFYTNYKHSWQEMLVLVDIALSLCKAASEWTPRPSTLEGGIRREVRTHIRPGLDEIREALQAHLDWLELKEKNKRKAEELERAQKRAKLMRRKQWEALQARMSSCRLSTARVPQPKQPTCEEEVIDVDELDDEAPYHNMGVKAIQSRPPMARQATEEIPAPDPIVTWTEQEQIALLNGLQRFGGADRYDRILETCIELNMKDIDQCMARARYHKQACRQLLAEEAAKGGHSYDWLRSV